MGQRYDLRPDLNIDVHYIYIDIVEYHVGTAH